MAKLGQDVISISTDNSVISMDTDNEDIEDNIFMATAGAEFDLTESCPDIYRCPISKELMSKPVMLHDDGHTYDEESLQEWLSENNRSPLTGVDLKNKSYTRNYALQSAIEQFQTAKEAHITKQKMRQKSREILGIDNIMESSPTSPSEHNQSQSGTDMDLVSQDELKQSEEDILNTLSPHIQQLQETQDVMIYNKLKSFLSAISLDEYVSTFINAGFVSMNDFSNITFNDLVAMNIPIIHSRRMITAIDKYNNDLESKLNEICPNGLKDVPLTNSIIIRPGRIPKSQNSAPLNCNILLLGDAYVGKTSLRKRLELDDFVATQATQGVELTCLLSNFQGEDLQITIWDPAGQERYAPITKTFFRRAHAAAIIFSADDPTTWKHVEYWMNELETNAPDDIEFMLICNKIDLLNQDDDNGDIELNEVIKNAINVAAKKRVPFYTTSAKSGESVKQAFQELVSLLLNNHAILDKLYQQRDGNLGRGSSYHGPNPYKDRNHGSSDEDNKGSEEDDDSSPTRRGSKKGKRMAKIKKKLSWRHKKNQSQVFTEYTEDDYAVNLDQKMNSQNDIQSNGGGCCK